MGVWFGWCWYGLVVFCFGLVENDFVLSNHQLSLVDFGLIALGLIHVGIWTMDGQEKKGKKKKINKWSGI